MARHSVIVCDVCHFRCVSAEAFRVGSVTYDVGKCCMGKPFAVPTPVRLNVSVTAVVDIEVKS